MSLGLTFPESQTRVVSPSSVISCSRLWARAFPSCIGVVVSRMTGRGARFSGPCAVWSSKATHLCPGPWGVASAAHPSPKPGQLYLHSGACLASPASVYPPGLRAPEMGPASASCWESLPVLRSWTVEQPGCRSELRDATHLNERGVQLAQPCPSPQLASTSREGWTTRKPQGAPHSGCHPQSPQSTGADVGRVCLPVGGCGALPCLDQQGWRGGETSSLCSPTWSGPWLCCPFPRGLVTRGARKSMGWGGRWWEVVQTCMRPRQGPRGRVTCRRPPITEELVARCGGARVPARDGGRRV